MDAFAIVASTGGPSAIARILRALPPTLAFPVLVVQHITDGFAAGLARWLNSVCALPVARAEDGVECQPGHVYVAPDGLHLEMTPARAGRLRARLVPGNGGHVPSGDRLLHSLARALGPRAGAVVLTGMGEDGADGLLAVRRAGGLAWAQDEASSTVYGMPRAALAPVAIKYGIRAGRVARPLAARTCRPSASPPGSPRNDLVASSALHVGESGYRYNFDKPWGTNMDDEKPFAEPMPEAMPASAEPPKAAAKPAVKKARKKAAKKPAPKKAKKAKKAAKKSSAKKSAKKAVKKAAKKEEEKGQEVEALSALASLRKTPSGESPEALSSARRAHARRLTRNTAAAQATMPDIATLSSRSANST